MVPLLQDFPAYLRARVFKEDATVYDLLTIALSFAVLWAIVFAVAKPLLRSVSYGRPWLRSACERDYERGDKEQLKEFSKGKNKEEVVEHMMEFWPWIQVLNIQHVSGGVFCIPSCFGLGDPSWASSLAVCGIMSEIGWEIEDTAERVIDVAKNGLQKSNIPMYIMLAVHHSLASLMGVPMVLRYRNLRPLHWLAFDLQMGSATGVITEYSKILDISRPNELLQFKVINFVLLAAMVWFRFLHWTYCCAQIVLTWYRDEAWTFLAVGSVVISAFSLFNAAVCVVPMYKRFVKFLHVSAEYESLPPGATDTRRRQSMIQLEEAAGELVLEGGIDMEGRAQRFLNSLKGRRKLDRSMTMPPRRLMALKSARFKYRSEFILSKDD